MTPVVNFQRGLAREGLVAEFTRSVPTYCNKLESFTIPSLGTLHRMYMSYPRVRFEFLKSVSITLILI